MSPFKDLKTFSFLEKPPSEDGVSKDSSKAGPQHSWARATWAPNSSWANILRSRIPWCQFEGRWSFWLQPVSYSGNCCGGVAQIWDKVCCPHGPPKGQHLRVLIQSIIGSEGGDIRGQCGLHVSFHSKMDGVVQGLGSPDHPRGSGLGPLPNHISVVRGDCLLQLHH